MHLPIDILVTIVIELFKKRNVYAWELDIYEEKLLIEANAR